MHVSVMPAAHEGCGKVYRTSGNASDVLRFLGAPYCRACHAPDTPLHVCVLPGAHEQRLVVVFATSRGDQPW